MNGPPPQVVTASAYRQALADEIAEAVKAGCSVALVGTRSTDDVLELAAEALAGASIRVLAIRPPFESTSFIRQFAAEWRVSGQDGSVSGAATLPEASGERFAMLLHQAELIPAETFRHVERLARAWPGMQMVFAGRPGVAELVRAKGLPVLAERVSRVIKVSAADEMRWLQDGGAVSGVAEPAAAPLGGPIMLTRVGAELPELSYPVRPLVHGGWLGRAATWSIAGLVVALIMTMTALPRLPRVGGVVVSKTDVALQAPEPAAPSVVGAAAGSVQANIEPTIEPIVEPTLKPGPQIERSLPQAEAGRGAAAESTTLPPTVAIGPAEALPGRADTVQEVAAASTPVPAHPDAAGRAENEDGNGPALRPSASSSTPSPSSAMAEAMTRRGLAMLEIGDVSAARLLLARAAGAGSGPAAYAMGTTFDAVTLSRIRAVGIVADPVVAGAWYRFALGLGEDRARAMLDALPVDVVTTRQKDTP